MIDEGREDKIVRVLQIYAKLSDGYIVNKAEEAQNYNVNERSIQRDIDDIRYFLDVDTERTGIENAIIYDREQKGYRLESLYHMRLTNSEVLALCKILLDSRAFTKTEMVSMLDKLISCCVPEKNQKLVKDLIVNEEFHYIEPRHKSEFTDKMWDIGQAIRNKQYIEIQYQGIQGSTIKTRKLKPLAIMFSEFYFYLTAFIDDKRVRENFSVLDDAFPTIYRIDRIQSLKVLDEHFFMRDMYPHIVLIPTEVNGIQLKYIVLAVWLVINIITFVVLPKMDPFKKVFLRREKVALILSFLGGAAGGYLAIAWKEKHFNAVVLKRSMPFMAGMHAVVLTCVLSLGMIRLF